jgi:hypothetical protein
MSNWIESDFQQGLTEVVRRTQIDPEFRTLALKDSRAAFQKVTGKKMPTDFNIQFIDNSGPTKVVPLPDLVSGLDEKDIEAELENVAGGTITVAGVFGSAGPKPSPKPLQP